MLHFQRWVRPLISWLGGNVAWGVAIFVFTKIAGDRAMIEAVGLIGFLVLIVIGLAYIMLRDRGGATSTAQYETMARYVTMMFLAQEHGIRPGDLADLSNPQAMEERAKRLQIEASLRQHQSTPSISDTEGSPRQ